ncbi:MAG TPA: host attachment protein [Candidatus Desulfobacillus sp.]|nr:host attachment protein [Candidatus Desulfobacillus sp.]
MATTWILVANASQAKLYANTGPKKGLVAVKDLQHPESREKTADLVSDRPGQLHSPGVGQRASQPKTSPKENEARHFAQELARELNHARASGHFDRVILVAPPAFMGLINEKLDGPTAQLVSDRFEKDYTRSTARELAGRLESCIYL